VWQLSGQEHLTVTTLWSHTYTAPIMALQFTPDGQSVVGGCEDRTLRLWEVSKGKITQTLGGMFAKHSSPICAIAVSPNGRLVASGSEDKTIRIWELGSGKCLCTLTGHSSHVRGLSFTPDGFLLVSGGWDNTLVIWEAGNGRSLRTIAEPFRFGDNGFNAVVVSPDSQWIATGNENRLIHLWDFNKGERVHSFPEQKTAVSALAFAPRGNILVSGNQDGLIQTWDMVLRQQRDTLKGHSKQVTSLSLHPRWQLSHLREPGQFNSDLATPMILGILDRAVAGNSITPAEGYLLLTEPYPQTWLQQAADELRRTLVGEPVSYVVNRNVNFTNICEQHCGFCAFRRDGGQPGSFWLTMAQVTAKVQEAVAQGATEICLQGGLNPHAQRQGSTLAYYRELVTAIKTTAPGIHLHAFSPQEIQFISRQDGISIAHVLKSLQEAGVDSLPGTAAEVLDDQVRRVICPEKIDTATWLGIVAQAHQMGIPPPVPCSAVMWKPLPSKFSTCTTCGNCNNAPAA
jgi:hypothetical protein